MVGLERGELTRVIISMNRQKAKKIPKSILVVWFCLRKYLYCLYRSSVAVTEYVPLLLLHGRAVAINRNSKPGSLSKDEEFLIFLSKHGAGEWVIELCCSKGDSCLFFAIKIEGGSRGSALARISRWSGVRGNDVDEVFFLVLGMMEG